MSTATLASQMRPAAEQWPGLSTAMMLKQCFRATVSIQYRQKLHIVQLFDAVVTNDSDSFVDGAC